MPLVPQKTYMTWFNKKSWMYSQFSYCYQNSLWHKNVPVGYSLCPYFWQSILVGFLGLRLFLVPIVSVLGWILKNVFYRYIKIGYNIRKKIYDSFPDMKSDVFLETDGCELILLFMGLVIPLLLFLCATLVSSGILKAYEVNNLHLVVFLCAATIVIGELLAIGVYKITHDDSSNCNPLIYPIITGTLGAVSLICISIKVIVNWIIYTLIYQYIWSYILVSIWEVICDACFWIKELIVGIFFNSTGFICDYWIVIVSIFLIWVLVIIFFKKFIEYSTTQVEKEIENEKYHSNCKSEILSGVIKRNKFSEMRYHIEAKLEKKYGFSYSFLVDMFIRRLAEYIIFDEKLVDISKEYDYILSSLSNSKDNKIPYKELKNIISEQCCNIVRKINPLFDNHNNKILSFIESMLKEDNPEYSQQIDRFKKIRDRKKYMDDLCLKITGTITKIFINPFILINIYLKKLWHVIVQIVSYFWDRAKSQKEGVCPYIKFTE